MTTDVSSRSLRAAILAIALVAASLLAYQVLLTRVCALRMHFHFGFLIISNSLLGIGASGSVLALFERRFRLLPDQWILRFSILYLISLPLSWFAVISMRIPETLRFTNEAGVLMWDQTLLFAGFNLACAVPFFFGGLAIGLILTANARRVGQVYAADLLGAGLGCLLCPLLLWDVGAGGCFAATLVLAALACLVARSATTSVRLIAALLGVCFAALIPFLDQWVPVPGKRWLDLTNEHTVTEFGLPKYTRWSPNSRIDVLPLPEGAPRFLQARGGKAMAMPLPQQWWIGQDGDAGTMLTDFGREPEKLEVLRQTSYSASFRLKEGQNAKVCVIGVGGAPDLWAAKLHDLAEIRGIELNEAILEVHDTVAAEFSKPLLEDPRVQLVCAEGRNELMRTDERFDVIQLTGIDTWTALNSGAYVLAENYLYTVEACRTMYDRLNEGGILQITRMAAGMETIRLMNNMFHALPEEARAEFADSIAALRTPDYLMTVMLKKGGFSAEEAESIRRFSIDAQIGLVYLPDGDGRAQVAAVKDRLRQAEQRVTRLDQELKRLQDEIDARTAGVDDERIAELRRDLQRIQTERQQFGGGLEPLKVKHDVGQFVISSDKAEFVDSYPYDVSPTTDDRPYFFSFLKWSDSELAAENLHKPTWVVQGNPLFLRNQLLMSAVAALLFILLPLVFRRGAASGGGTRRGALRFLVYFAGLGVGFIGIEVALIQKFTLLLGLPMYSIVVTLCAILIFTGIGSLFSQSLIGGEPERARWVPIALFVIVGALAFLSPTIVELCIGLPLEARCAVVAGVIAPIGLLLGIPFAHGVRVVEQINPSFVPWAWAVNGCTTVVGSIVTVILSMMFGFAAVLFAATLVYLIAFAAIDALARDALSYDSEEPVEETEEEEPAEPVSVS